MSDKFFQTLERGRKIISSADCEYADIRLAVSEGTGISLSKDNVESVTAGESVGGSVRILKNGSWGFVTFNNLDSLEKYFDSAVKSSMMINAAEKSVIAKAEGIKASFKTPAKRPAAQVHLDEKFELINSYNRILMSSEKIQTSRAVYRDVNTFYGYLNSEGSDLFFDKSYCGISLMSVAKSGNIVQPFHDSVSGYGGFELVLDKMDIAEKVVKTSVDLLSAEPLQGGRYSVILDPKLCGVFIHEAFGHLSEADFVYENPAMREIMELGRVFGPEFLNVYDDGSIPDLSGYIPFDDEGVSSGATALIKNGILSGRLHSRETACKMNEEPTGNARAIGVMRQPIVRMTNTYIDNGGSTREEIFDAVDNGIYAVDVIGGQTNLEMFTFTAGYGYMIKNGRPGRMFRDVILSGNVFNTLKNIKMIGNDRRMFGGLGGCGKGGQSPLPVSFGGPHMLIDDVLIGGK